MAIDRTEVAVSEASDSSTEVSKRSKSFRELMGNYFKEGQLLTTSDEDQRPPPPPNSLWVYKKFIYDRPRLAGIFIPAVFFWIIWISVMAPQNLWYLFKDNYYVTIVMIFGSMLAGATSEGGAAVAFPVLTLAFSVTPVVARDFGLMIQTAGMSAASFTILYQNIQLEWRALWFVTLGGVPGVCIGLGWIAPQLPPPVTKIAFVSVWLAFAAALLMLNLNIGRQVLFSIPSPKLWKNCVLLFAGFIGGIFSSISGSGIDICSFAVLTLLFRVTEKVATPTSVVLMAINTSVGFFFKNFWLGGMEQQSWEFVAVAVPVVVVGAPMGAFLGSYCHRQVLAAFVYITDTVQYIGAMVIVLPKVPSPALYGGVSAASVVVGWGFFYVLTHLGKKLLDKEIAAGAVQDNREIDNGHKVVDAAKAVVSSAETVQSV